MRIMQNWENVSGMDSKENGECISGEQSAVKLYHHADALEKARANWNTRAPILSAEELELIDNG